MAMLCILNAASSLPFLMYSYNSKTTKRCKFIHNKSYNITHLHLHPLLLCFGLPTLPHLRLIIAHQPKPPFIRTRRPYRRRRPARRHRPHPRVLLRFIQTNQPKPSFMRTTRYRSGCRNTSRSTPHFRLRRRIIAIQTAAEPAGVFARGSGCRFGGRGCGGGCGFGSCVMG
jgi:hypothetical protein